MKNQHTKAAILLYQYELALLAIHKFKPDELATIKEKAIEKFRSDPAFRHTVCSIVDALK